MYRRHPEATPGRSLCALLLAALCWPGMAPADQQPGAITINADEATFNQRDGSGVYRGNVELHQGLRHLSAEHLEVFVDEQGELVRVEAQGNPLVLREGDQMEASALEMVYEVPEQRILLREKARIRHEGRTFSGSRVEYDLAERRVEAFGEGEDRVRMVIPGRGRDGEEQAQ